jgi:PAS domain S-box-containing protein
VDITKLLHPRSIIIGWIAMMIGLNGFIVRQIWEGRQHVLQQSDEAQTLQHRVLLANVEQTLRQYDYIASELAERELPKDVNAELRRLKALDPLLMDILIMSPTGVTQYWSGTGTPPNAADRDFFAVLRGDPQRTLYVSPSRLSRAHVGKWYFSLSRPMRDAAGNFQGVVVAIIDLEVFNRDLAGSLAIDDASLAILLADGQVITRLPDVPGSKVTKIELPDAVKLADDERVISLQSVSVFDRSIRLFKWKLIPKYGVRVVASITKDRVLDLWWSGFQGALLIWGLLNILMIAGAIALIRAVKQNLAQIATLQASRESLSASEERLRLAMTSANQGWFDVDLRTGKVDVSPEYVRMIGYVADDFKTDLPNWLNHVHPEDRDALTAAFQACVTNGGPVSMEYRRKTKSGDWKWIQSIGKIVQRDAEQRATRMLGIHTDITDRKQTEMEILRSNAELEQFSYAISHDMRQPLRMISSYMQLLEKGLADHLDAEKRQFFGFAIDGAKRMDAMMLGLLEYSRVGRKGEPPAWVESRAMLDGALMFLQPAIAEAQANVCIEGDWPRIHVSPDEILRLMQNLIGNALKFRIAGRTPEVIVDSEMVEGEWRICIADNGVGILPNQIGRLFQVFQRLQSRADYEGTGIGLALCRKIVEHHGGRIWAESEGEGSKFYVVLPQQSSEL